MFDLFKWLVTLLSLVGVVLNIRHKRACFAIWIGTNAAWTAIDIWHEVYQQAVLQAIYCGLAVWGWLSWRRPLDTAAAPTA